MPPLSEQISQSVSLLPEAYQRQVLDFIEFLQVKYRNAKPVESDAEVSVKRRTFPQAMIGKVEILGDIVGSLVGEEDWECLK